MSSQTQPTKEKRLPISLHPLTTTRPSDIPTLAHISGLAFETDTHTLLKSRFHGRRCSSFHEDGTRQMLESLTSNPRCDIIVARTDSNGVDGEGDIAGFVVWSKTPNFDSPPDGEVRSMAVGEPPEPPAEPERKTVEGLEEWTNASMAAWQAYLAPRGSRCRYIIAISVHPDFQGKGVGRALVRWGTERADRDGVGCWVQSSMDGSKVFEKEGFTEVDRLETDLGGWAEGVVREGGGSWGEYVWKYMIRPPSRVGGA